MEVYRSKQGYKLRPLRMIFFIFCRFTRKSVQAGHWNTIVALVGKSSEISDTQPEMTVEQETLES